MEPRHNLKNRILISFQELNHFQNCHQQGAWRAFIYSLINFYDKMCWNQVGILKARNKSRSNCINLSPSIRHSSPKVGLNFVTWFITYFSQSTCIYLDRDLFQLPSYALQTFCISLEYHDTGNLFSHPKYLLLAKSNSFNRDHFRVYRVETKGELIEKKIKKNLKRKSTSRP